MKLKNIIEPYQCSKKTAIICGKNSITYEELYYRSTYLSKVIRENISSDRVAIFIPDNINYILGFLAIIKSEKAIVPINTSIKPLEVIETMTFCDASYLLTEKKLYLELKQKFDQLNSKIKIFVVEDLLNLSVKENEVKNVPPCDFTIMIKTSGTTSQPKVVLLTGENIVSTIFSKAQIAELNQNCKGLISLPMTSIYAMVEQLLTYLYLGMTFVIFDKIFSAKDFFSLIETEHITHYECAPTILTIIDEYKNFNMYRTDSLHFIGFGGAPANHNLLLSLTKKFPHIKFIPSYGLSESAALVAHMDLKNYNRKLFSVGKVLNTISLKFIEGEIVVKGPNIMLGYYKNQLETSRALQNGYLYTGDLGYLDEEGYLYITGRKKNIIISGGFNISPEEIENVLINHEKIVEALVYSEDDKFLGEKLVAEIVLLNSSENEISAIDIIQYCDQFLPSYKIPRKIIFVNNLEKTSTGKLKRKRTK